MKRSSKWDEKTIESHLRKMPKIEDKQSKEALFAQIQDKLQENNVKVRKKKSWMIPAVASAAVLFLLFLIIPPFMNDQNIAIDGTETEDDVGIQMEINEYPVEDTDKLETDEFMGIQTTEEASEDHYFGAAQTGDALQFAEEIITIGVVAHYPTGEVVIPITVLAVGETKLDKFMNVKDMFSGERWGINSFPPIQINSIKKENNTVLIDVPAGSLESLSSSEGIIYRLALEETFSFLGFNKIKFSSDQQSGVIWGKEDFIEEIPLQLPNRGYFLFESQTGHQFLVTGRSVSAPVIEHSSFEEILQHMQQSNENQGYKAAIPEEVVIKDIEIIGEVATITFDPTTISNDHSKNLIMIEAIMFAAKDFGINFIQFEGLNYIEIGPYMVQHLIEIPKYPNFIR